MDPRKAFEQWYIENAFDYESAPIGSRDFEMQWRAWLHGMMLGRVAIENMTSSDISSVLDLQGNLHKGIKKE
jgi:hypothetical protein